MNITDEIKLNIHLYVILELAIKSTQHDKKLFESFKVKRPYLSFCDQQLEILKKEFKIVTKSLYKHGVKFEKYLRTGINDCLYSFVCRGEVVPFHYYGDTLKTQVERKLKLTWQSMEGKEECGKTPNN